MNLPPPEKIQQSARMFERVLNSKCDLIFGRLRLPPTTKNLGGMPAQVARRLLQDDFEPVK